MIYWKEYDLSVSSLSFVYLETREGMLIFRAYFDTDIPVLEIYSPGHSHTRLPLGWVVA